MGGAIAVPVGAVLKQQSIGTTNVLAAHPHGPGEAAWIEHATAKGGDVLPADEVTAGTNLMAQHKAAIATYRAAEAAKPKTPPSITLGATTLTEMELTALKAMLVAKPTT